MYSCYIAPENTQSFQISEIVKDGWVIFEIKKLNICFWEAERNERTSVEKPLEVILFVLQIKNQVYLPSILADKCSKISMSFCIMDSLCHFLFVKYGQKARNCRSRVN